MEFEVEAKCGHVGRNNYVIKTFAIIANNGKEAAAKVRKMPRVKHDHKDAIISVKRVNHERFYEINLINLDDPYFKCKNVQEQRTKCELLETEREEKKVIKYTRTTRVYRSMKKKKIIDIELNYLIDEWVKGVV